MATETLDFPDLPKPVQAAKPVRVRGGTGRSDRTPAKHELMCRMIGKEVGAAGYLPAVDRLVWYDLTAGDGVAPDGLPWQRNCSPGILASYARNSAKPVTVLLHEIKAATLDRLEASLAEHLPALGYLPDGDWWWYRNARLRVLPLSGAEADLTGVDQRTAVFATNDPNAITDWAMRPTFVKEIHERTGYLRALSTMGCNPAGLKRLKLPERMLWFDLIERHWYYLPRNHDLLLAAIEKDDAQWAYLLDEPCRPEWRRAAEKAVNGAFGLHGMSMASAWRGTDPRRFERIERQLFLTKKELAT